MMTRKHGKIINIASEYSQFGAQSGIPYAAAKGGLVQTTKTMAIELAPHNIQVNAIVPGWTANDLTIPAQPAPFYYETIMRTPAGRSGQPDGLPGSALFPPSHSSHFSTTPRDIP